MKMNAGVFHRIQIDCGVVDEVQVGHHDAAGSVVGDAQVGVVELPLECGVVAVTLARIWSRETTHSFFVVPTCH